MKVIRVYMAGKIGKNDWRHQIVPALRGVERWHEIEFDSRFIYTGPFFVACDHGCYHGPTTHGRGLGIDTCECGESVYPRYQTRVMTFRLCRESMERSDVVFAWIDSMDAYGTLVEIGMAHEMDKPIFLALSSRLKNPNELWFAGRASSATESFLDVQHAWSRFTRWVEEGA